MANYIIFPQFWRLKTLQVLSYWWSVLAHLGCGWCFLRVLCESRNFAVKALKQTIRRRSRRRRRRRGIAVLVLEVGFVSGQEAGWEKEKCWTSTIRRILIQPKSRGASSPRISRSRCAWCFPWVSAAPLAATISTKAPNSTRGKKIAKARYAFFSIHFSPAPHTKP